MQTESLYWFFLCHVSIRPVLGADVSYRFARRGHLLGCRALWAFPRNNNFITMTLDVPKMFINTITFCLSSYALWIERPKFTFLVLKQLLFCINESCNQPARLPCERCVLCLTSCSDVWEQNGCKPLCWGQKDWEQASKYTGIKSFTAFLCVLHHTGIWHVKQCNYVHERHGKLYCYLFSLHEAK